MMSTREKHPKIHRIALVDNDPRALDSLSAVIASKVPSLPAKCRPRMWCGRRLQAVRR